MHSRIPFYCPIGKTDVAISVMIEPDPHGDESGTHAHFHTFCDCENTKVCPMPEPERCKLTNNTCPFIAPICDEPNLELRKTRYANEIIQNIAFIELYGSQLINAILNKKRLSSIKNNMNVSMLEKILVVSEKIDSTTYQEMGKLRRIRNKLAHSPKEYLKFTETELYKLALESHELALLIKSIKNS